MSHHSLLCLLLLAAVIKGSAEVVCDSLSTTATSSARKRIHSTLLCEYDTQVRPQSVANVTVEMFVRRAKVVDLSLHMEVLAIVRWADHFLKWDPARFDNVKEIQLSSNEIWNPPVISVSTLPWDRESATTEDSSFWPAVCHVTFEGSVTCSSSFHMGGACVASFFYWPHTEASCVAFLGSDFRTHRNLSVVFYNDSVQAELSNYVPDSNWVVTEAKREVFALDATETRAMTYQFKLHARGAVILTALVGPAVVLSVMMLVSFCLPAQSFTRLGLSCCSTFGIILASSLLFETLPPYDGPNPVIVIVYSGLLVLSAIANIMPLLLSFMAPPGKKMHNTPRWLYSLQSWLTHSAPGKLWLKLLFMSSQQTGDLPTPVPRDGDENCSGAESHQADSPHPGPHQIWNFMASFLNRITFLVFLVVCITFSLYLLHNLAVYEDVDIGWIE